MSTSTADVRAQRIVITDDSLTADLSDGRSISVPLAWYPVFCTAHPKSETIGV